MQEPLSLIKANPLLPAEDYAAMRKAGIESIEKTGSDIWTDYNNSDPGITILEAVCYAITDLSYRTGFDIKDLLAPENLTEDTWKNIFYTARKILHNSPLTLNDYRKMIIDVKGVRNAWVEVSKNYEVPVWVDYNYFYEDISNCSCDGINRKICWGRLGLQAETEVSIKIFKDSRTKELESKRVVFADKMAEYINALSNPLLTDEENLKLKELIDSINEEINFLDSENLVLLNAFIPSKIVEFEGLYNVMVEYEENLNDREKDQVRDQINRKLNQNRNLCEDFLSVNEVDYEEFGIHASIVLEEYADPDAVLSMIFFTIYKYFTPSIRFYTIQQLQEKGLGIDEIFEGPPLKHGFINTEELEKTDLFRDIRLSDIINEIADIKDLKGTKLIKGITYFHLNTANDASIDSNYFYTWVTALQEERKIARIQPLISKVVFCKERDVITYYVGRPEDRRPDRMLKLFRDLKTAEQKYKLTGHDNDFKVPAGENMELEEYFPVTHSLPRCYGVNDQAGLPAEADENRKVQALQLGGYMLFFEQILSDHLVQLNHLRDLFSFDDSVNHTYYTKVVKNITNLKELLIDSNNYGGDHFDKILKAFSHNLQNIVEDKKLFHKRRNTFLNHLLARFSEDMSEYENISRWLTPYKVDERLIADKIRLLKDGEYYQISSDRGNGYDYSGEYWDTHNVSGTERRVSRLLGFQNVNPETKNPFYLRRSLVPDFIVIKPAMELDSKRMEVPILDEVGIPKKVIVFLNPANMQEVIFTSVEVKDGCCTELLINQILEHADNRKYFKFRDEQKYKSRKNADTGTYWLELYDRTDFDSDDAIQLGKSEIFHKNEEREQAYKKFQEIIDKINENEGMHLVEHLLLRPKFEIVEKKKDGEFMSVELLNICLDECDLGIGIEEGATPPPYRKKITRIPSEICFDKMPWVLEYFKSSDPSDINSLLFQEFEFGTVPSHLKFKKYENLVKRIRKLFEFGSEGINYDIVLHTEHPDVGPEINSYCIKINGEPGVVLAQSAFNFSSRQEAANEIKELIAYFSFELSLYCNEDSCDNNEDPYSFRATAVIPCWPKRFRDATFRNLVEKTIETESPAHVQVKVVWVGIAEMQRFEDAFKPWLKEMADTEMPTYEKVNPLVETLMTLLPCGSCEDECGDHEA